MKATIPTFTPADTPQIIKHILLWTAFLTVVGAMVDSMLSPWIGIHGMQYYLSASKLTLTNSWVWQPLTYLFVLQPYGGLSFGLLISLFFQLFILWVMGSQVVQRYGARAFATLYFGSGILAALLCMGVTMHPIAGPTASLFALFVLWALMMQDATVLAFFVLPISVKWLLAAVLGATFLINVSQWDGAGLILMLTGTLWGYFYATAFRGLKTPFPFTHKADKWLAKQRERFLAFFTRKKGKEEKIVDISTGKQPLSDEEFVDKMLEKISNFGEESLTPQEKKRLDQIARNKKI